MVKSVLKELEVDQKTVVINCDSQNAICLSKNQTHHEKTKHIDINYTLLGWRHQRQL